MYFIRNELTELSRAVSLKACWQSKKASTLFAWRRRTFIPSLVAYSLMVQKISSGQRCDTRTDGHPDSNISLSPPNQWGGGRRGGGGGGIMRWGTKKKSQQLTFCEPSDRGGNGGCLRTVLPFLVAIGGIFFPPRTYKCQKELVTSRAEKQRNKK